MRTRWLLFLLGAASLWAQEETLLDDQMSFGGFGGPVFKAAWAGSGNGVVTGGRGAWIINHRFTLGGGGYGLISDVKTDQFSTAYLDFKYSGFEIGYIDKPDRLIHGTACLLLGGGNASLKTKNPREEIARENFFVVEPSAGIEVNVTHWFRIDLTGGWLIPFGLESIEASQVGGANVAFTLKFGKF